MHSLGRIHLLTIVIACLVSNGCGPGRPPLYPVEGTVTSDGKPVTEGVITFEDAAAGIAESGKLSSDGSYTVQLLKGTYKVGLMPVFVEQQAEDGTMEEVLKNPDDFPTKYQNVETSGLSVTVSGETKFDVSMTKN